MLLVVCSCVLGAAILLFLAFRAGVFDDLIASTPIGRGPGGWVGGWTGAAGGDFNVTFQAGMGAGGKHAFHKSFGGAPFPASDGAIASFEINFAPGFEWSCGGKIGGFEIGSGPASGCRHSSDGASHRFNFNPNNSAKAYVYVPDGTQGRQPGPLQRRLNCGNGVFEDDFQGVFTEGRWHTIRMGVKLNTPGQANGKLMLSVDGRERVLDNVIMRSSAGMNIQGFQFGMFHGGGCKATKTSQLSVRNLKFGTWR